MPTNEALRSQVERDRRLRALDEFIRGYEAEHGELTAEEMAEGNREVRSWAVVIRGDVRRGTA